MSHGRHHRAAKPDGSTPDGALVAAYLDAGDRGDWVRLSEHLAPDVVTHSPGDITETGVEHQIGSWAAAHRGLDGLHHEIVDIVTSDGFVAARIRVTGTHTGLFLGVETTGRNIAVDQALFVRVAGQRIAELWEVVDTGSGLRQLGLIGDQRLGPHPDDP
ncbi:MAG: ester cyclase [Acidimicrobiia bacterium]